MGNNRKTRQEYKKENNRLREKNKKLEARESVKYLHKLEKEIRGLRVIIKTHELNLIQKNKKIKELAGKIIQEESFNERLERKNKEMKRSMRVKK